MSWNIFKDFGNTIIAEDVTLKTQQMNKTIEKIHNEFYSEVDVLKKFSEQEKTIETDKQHLIDKRDRLLNLGFKNTKEVKEAEIEIARLNNLKKENRDKQELLEAINYFSFKYPNYKFITEESVKKICEKYGLVYGTINKYIGTVPNKNLKHIEDFKIKNEDECWLKIETQDWRRNSKEIFVNLDFINKERERIKSYPNYYFYNNFEWSYLNNYRITHIKALLEIVAPIKDFDMKQMQIKDFKLSKIEIPDPVVLQPVFYNNQKYYLIVTAWGLESEDESIVNQKWN